MVRQVPWTGLTKFQKDSGSDPLAVLRNIDTNLEEEWSKREEFLPTQIPEELKESGAVIVSLRDVRNSIGRDREGWKIALDSELQSLLDAGAIHAVKHLPSNALILPMKVVLTLKPIPGSKVKMK